ncbi:MAG: hypothetical protein IK152_06590 [Lachnospiraceae bacterium]|nr:hypothetical protein [Lachnospiraceae bacterium]
MFYLEGINDLKFRSEKPKEASRKIVKTIKPNFSNLSYDGSDKENQMDQLYLSKEAREALENDKREFKDYNPFGNVIAFSNSRNPLETKFYVVAENVENKISNLYDQINYLSIELKKQG